MTSELIWQHLDTPGWEHVRISTDHPGWDVYDSIFVREDQGQILRGGYTLVTDKQWRTLELRLMVETSPGTMDGVHLMSEGDGRWTDANETHIPELDGILDIAIEWTPLTTTLPINRIQMKVGEGHQIPFAWISLPDLTINAIVLTCQRTDETHVHIQSPAHVTGAEVSTDERGFVVEDPGLFRRSH